jgi:hypothetical protein
MTIGRVIPHRLPSRPGKDSLYIIRHNPNQLGNPWWVYYEDPNAGLIPADAAHLDLVELVNLLKVQAGGQEGGSFSINEHFQVIARTGAPGHQTSSIHVIGIDGGRVCTHRLPLIFRLRGEVLDPTATELEGHRWPGPLCGSSYHFAAPRNTISGNLDDVWKVVGGQRLYLSRESGVSQYPPSSGALANFLAALRRQFPEGGRFRVNEHGRAFTSNTNLYIGVVPLDMWFRPLTSRS